ncbi:L,D-transpeptidase family protein [Nocardioides humilatus]|uniref:L,D-transpeptidase family protein n=1 Tax=Nocardioides humilatus TaxID=2607660 RepID=A0A5B1LIV9_9ACTN|nr:peptidoglycan-binding protein [Nocardioides humilatus]KAA1419499.1 L,D-transpeptidase family protein [Nocardioides humilatus]
MSVARRITFVATIAALLCGLAYGVGYAAQGGDLPWRTSARPAPDAPVVQPDDRPAIDPGEGPTIEPTNEPSDEPTDEPNQEPTDEPTEPELQPGPAILSPGDEGDDVRDLQARLAQIDWFNADVTGFYGDVTEEAVRGFQEKREIPVTGEVDRRTLDRLHAMTTEPTEAELTNTVTNTPGALDPRCLEGRVLCIDKTSSTLRWVIDGEVQKTLDARFGSTINNTPTREGVFHVNSKDADHISTLYGSSMPYAMFFSGGQAVHYSSDFAAVGYAGASHGCVNIRDYDGIAWLFSQVQVGDTVVVYWS